MSSRRNFITNTAALAGGSMLLSALDNKALAIFKNRVSPNEQINIGAIGIKGMGWANVNAALKVPGVNLVALCDVDQNVLDERMGEMAKLNVDAKKVKTYNDYRKLLEQ